MREKTTLIVAAGMGFVAVSLGAFGAHAFKPFLAATGRLDTFELAVRYQFYHALALLAAGILMQQNNSKWLRYAAVLFTLGIIFFCGSLYILCFTGIKSLGAVTPIGGVFFLAGWALMALSVNGASGK